MKKRKLSHGLFLLNIVSLGIEFYQDVRRNAYRMELEKSYLERKKEEKSQEDDSVGISILECSCGYMASPNLGIVDCPECGQKLSRGKI